MDYMEKDKIKLYENSKEFFNSKNKERIIYFVDDNPYLIGKSYKGIKIILGHINDWKNAPVWTPKKIKKQTTKWFKYLSKK